MKLELTKQAELELDRLNNLYGDENSPEYDYWDKMSEQEVLITDAGLYVDGAYEENEFIDLKEWARKLGICESETDSDAMFEKINKMIELEIVKIVE